MQTLSSELKAVIGRRLEVAGSREILAIASALCADDQPAVPAAQAVGERFQVIGDVVRDHSTGLEWTRGNVPGGRKSWSDAKAACEALELAGGGWRLPTVRELLGLVDYERHGPAIDTSVFECESAWYWSATDYKPASGCAWDVDFNSGVAFGYNRGNDGFVRAVRGGQF